MKTLIFDLDGTLWNTENSYYYAFNEYLKNHPEDKYQMKLDVVEELRAITMDKMAPKLFPNDSSDVQHKKIIECLKYSCEYLIKQEEVNKEIVNNIKLLSKEFNLYLVSNCPFEYINIFFSKCNLKEYFKDVIALGGFTKINDSDKAKNLEKIIEKHSLDRKNTFFVGDSNLDLKASQEAKCNFIYLTCEDNFEQVIKQKISNQKILNLCNWYKEYLYKDASVVLMKNNNQDEYKYLFGFLSFSKDEKTNTKVFKMMEQDALKNGAKSLVGPINYSSWFDYRLPLDNFDIHFLPDIPGTKFDIDMLYKLGYKEVYTYASTLSSINTRLEKLSSRNKLSSNYYDELITGEFVFDYAKEIFEVSSRCFKEGFLYSDVPYDAFNEIYMQWLRKLPFSIDLYMIREKNTKNLVAFGICYYDSINKMYVCKTAAILSEHQKSFIVMQLAKIVYERTRYHNADRILFHFQNEQKNTLSAFWKNHIILKKRYALFIKELKYENM